MRMEYIFETTYDKKALKTMARIVRKTVRKKHSRRVHIFGWIMVALGILMLLPLGEGNIVIDFRKIVTGLAVVVIAVTILFEDRLNGYLAEKRMLPGTKKSTTKFMEDGYISEVKAGTTEWKYENIELIAETSGYFAFIFGKNHAQVFDKSHMVGDVDEFRIFIKEKTGKSIRQIK